MVSKRQSFQEGHKRKFLAVIDATPECGRAVLYAGRRAAKTGGGLVLVFISPPGDFQHWIGVEEIMRAEAREEADSALDKYAQYAREKANIDPELVVREGKIVDEIYKLIEEDRDIAILVLAAGEGKEGPGPLVSSIAGRSAAFPIPVTIVPSDLSDADIEAVA
ncbi:MAG: universal stress protein [Salaquimonas sp.]|jgi:nucleotide-binding universal stress UspA family protein|nr:universal stress protein [Salaquimonas sp.]